MSKTAFIFPGQGAQYCGMGQDFYENTKTGKELFDMASELLGFSVPELCFEKNDRLDITEYTQAAMVTTSIAMMRVLEEDVYKRQLPRETAVFQMVPARYRPRSARSMRWRLT